MITGVATVRGLEVLLCQRKLLRMYKRPVLTTALIFIAILVFASTAFAVVELETLRYAKPVRAIEGKLTGGGHVARLSVQVYDNAKVWLDDSMSMAEKRKRQTLVASAEPNDRGEFKIKHLPKGFYGVEFGNGGMGGYNILSVLVNVDPMGTKDKLCVDVSLEGAPWPRSSIRKCLPK